MVNYKARMKNPYAVVIKTATQTVNSSTTLQNDDQLFFEASPSKVYMIELILFINAGTTADIKFGWSMPSGSSLSIQNVTNDPNVLNAGTSTNPNISVAGTGSTRTLRQYVKITTSTTPGTVNFEWAQNTSDAENTSVTPGSMIVVYQS